MKSNYYEDDLDGYADAKDQNPPRTGGGSTGRSSYYEERPVH